MARIEQTRIEKGLSRTALAKLSGINESSIRNWINGKDPNIFSIVKIADALGVTLDFLINGNGEEINLTSEEKTLVQKLRQLDDRDKNAVDVLVSGLNDQYQQSGKKYINFESPGSVADAGSNNKLV